MVERDSLFETKWLGLISVHPHPLSARVANDEVPILKTPNKAQSTPPEEFSKKIQKAING